MEWNVKNAVNPNVERQHLNKILKEISGSYADVNARLTAAAEGLGNVQSGLTTTITKVINNTLPAGDLATQVTLTGDVAGTSTKVPGQNAVTINTVLSGSYVGEAPIDGNIYWRFQGGWQQVPDAVANLATLPDNGYLVIDENGVYQSRSIVSADEVNIVVTNGDGNLGDTTINLAQVPDDGTGVLQLTSFDIYGRKTGTAEATTDDLPEGPTNLYFLDERAQDAVGTILVNTPTIELTYDDTVPSISADLSSEYKDRIDNALVLSNTPTDGDIPEYDISTGVWVAKKNPRELLIDGGNF